MGDRHTCWPRLGHLLLAGYGTIILQVLRGGNWLMLVAEAGQLALYGMNQTGIALSVNSLHKPSTPRSSAFRRFVRRNSGAGPCLCGRRQQDLRGRSHALLYYAAALSGNVPWALENWREAIGPLSGKRPHCPLQPPETPQNTPIGWTPWKRHLYRDRRILKHLTPKVGQITREDVITAPRITFRLPLLPSAPRR